MTQPSEPPARPLRGRHDLGEIVGYGYRLYFQNFAPLFALALLTAPLQLLSGVISQGSDSEAVSTATSFLQFPQILVSLVVTASLVHAVHTITGGEQASFNGALDAAFARFRSMFRTFLLLVGLALAAVLAGPFLAIYWLFKKEATVDGRRDWWLAIVPFALLFYLAIRWAFNAQAVMISSKESWAALDDSADAVRDNWWRVFGILVVVAMIIIGPTLVAGTASNLPPLAASAIIASVSSLVLPFAIIAQTLLYYDLKTRASERHTPIGEAVTPPASSEEPPNDLRTS